MSVSQIMTENKYMTGYKNNKLGIEWLKKKKVLTLWCTSVQSSFNHFTISSLKSEILQRG